jgi:hypothetical protein
LYFFIGPEVGTTYTVYRAITDYDNSLSESRIFILAFDLFIQNNQLATTTPPSAITETKLDVDIAFGYEAIDTQTTDANVAKVLAQITSKYEPLIRGSTLDKVESLELKSGKINYKITYLNSATHLSTKFIVYYDPKINKIMILNSVNLPSAHQFQELSDAEMTSDNLLTEVLKYVNQMHSGEMDNYKLQCASKGTLTNYTEYHIIWSSNGRQYRSFVRSDISNPSNLVETLFG